MTASFIIQLIPGIIAVASLATLLIVAKNLNKEKAILRRQVAELSEARDSLEEALKDLALKTSEISILYEISARGIAPLDYFVSRLAEMVRAETVEILLFEDQGRLKPVAAYGFPGPESPPLSVLDIPLLREGKKIGELKLTRFTGEAFREDEKRIISIIAERVTAAMEAKKVEAERERLEGKLKEKLAELEEFYGLAVGRELKMIKLEKEVAALRAELGRLPEARKGKGA